MMLNPNHKPYRHPSVLLPLTVIGLVCFALLDALIIPAGVIGLIGTGAVGQNGYDADIVSVSMLIRGLSGLGQLVLFIYTPICFGMLVYRYAMNARAIGFTSFNHSAGWCIGWFFIPFAHLWMPYKANSEIWQASQVSDPEQIRLNEWWEQPIGWVFKTWWFTWIFGTIGNNIASRLTRSSTESFEISGYWLMPFAAITQVASAIFAIVVITRMASRQRQQHDHLSAYTANPAVNPAHA